MLNGCVSCMLNLVEISIKVWLQYIFETSHGT